MCKMCRKDTRSLEPSRRSFILAVSAAGVLLANGAVAKETKAPPKPQNVLSPDAALKRLKSKEMNVTSRA
jgi:carbonic anhydrase